MENSGQSVTVRKPEATFTFDHISYRNGAMEAVLSVWRAAPLDPLAAMDFDVARVFRYHISASSLSNVTAFRRELDKFHGDDINWGLILHDAIREAMDHHIGTIVSLDPQAVPVDAVSYLVEGVFPLNRVSCVFGMGGSGKSMVVESAMAASSEGVDWLDRRTSTGNTLWLDYENEDEGDFGNRRQGLSLGGLSFMPGSIRWMPGMGVPLPDLVERIGREMRAFHCTNFVVDSVMFACGGDPTKAEVATGFCAALAKLPLSTKILIAHTDKAENDKFPFGSIFWHNGIHGQSWFIKGVQSEGVLDIGWYGRKSSNGPKQHDFAARFSFDEDEKIILSEGNIFDVNRETGRQGLSEKIELALAEGKMGTKELAEAIGADQNTVRVRANEMKSKGRIVKIGKEWALGYSG